MVSVVTWYMLLFPAHSDTFYLIVYIFAEVAFHLNVSLQFWKFRRVHCYKTQNVVRFESNNSSWAAEILAALVHVLLMRQCACAWCPAARCVWVCMMAAYVEILKNEFPQIDSELFDYITGTVQIYDINIHMWRLICAVSVQSCVNDTSSFII